LANFEFRLDKQHLLRFHEIERHVPTDVVPYFQPVISLANASGFMIFANDASNDEVPIPARYPIHLKINSILLFTTV
jgi:hypothetical protein